MAAEMIRLARKAFPWAVSVAVLAALLSRLDLGELPRALAAADPLLLLLSLAAALLYSFVVTVRKYRHLLGFMGVTISEAEARLIRVGSMSLKAVVPAKAGEFARAVYLNRVHDVPYGKGVFLIAFGYATRLPVLLSLSLAGAAALHSGLGAAALAGLCGLALAVALLLGKKYRPLVLYSLLSELFLMANFIFAFMAFGIDIPAGEFFLYVPLILILTGLPLSVMGIGVREASVAAAFAGAAAYPILLSCALAISFMESVLPLLLSTLLLKKFVSRMSLPAREPEAFDPERYFERRNNNPLTGYRLKRRIREVVDALSRHCPGGELSVLDIGAADGVMLDAVRSGLSVKRAVGVELFRELIERRKSDSIEILQGKGEELPFGPGEFDAVLICSVIEHVDDAEKTLAEAGRVLKDDGRLVITAVNGLLDKAASLLGIKPDDHLRTYTVAELSGRLEAHGFRVLEARSFGPVFYNLLVAGKIPDNGEKYA